MAEVSTVAVLLLSIFSNLSEALDRYHSILDQLNSVREDREEYASCCDHILNLATRYNTTLRPLLPEGAAVEHEDEAARTDPERAAEFGRKYLNGLTKDSQRMFAETIDEMEKAMSQLHQQLRLTVHPTLRLPTPKSIIFSHWTISAMPGDDCIARFRDGRAQRDRLLNIVEMKIYSLNLILAPGREEESIDSPYFDLVSDLFPRLRKPDRTWLRLRLSTANGVRKRFLQHCSKRSDYTRIIRQPSGFKPEDLLERYETGTAPSRSEAGVHFSRQPIASEPKLYQILDYESLDISSRAMIPRRFDVPLVDDANESATGFQCPYCQSQQNGESQASWRTHVLSDLRAYICTSRTCELRMFKTIEEWIEHELTEHGSTSTQHCEAACTTASPIAAGDKSTGQAEKVHSKCLTAEACLFCDWNAAGESDKTQTSGQQRSIHEYKRHVGEHLEEIALAVIMVGAEGFAPLEFKHSVDLPHLLFKRQELSLRQRYRIALAIACSYALYVPTPWLASAWQSNDIFFFMVNGVPQYEAPRLRTELRIFQEEKGHTERSRPGVMEDSFVSLGILLLELYFGTTFEDRIRHQKKSHQYGANLEGKNPDPIELLAIAMRWADEAEKRAGYLYAKAVRHCLTERIDRSSNQEWRHEIDNVVVKPLRYNYEMLADLDMRHTGGSCPPSSPRQCQESWRSVEGSTVDVQWT